MITKMTFYTLRYGIHCVPKGTISNYLIVFYPYFVPPALIIKKCTAEINLNTQNILNVYRYTGSPDDDGWLSSAKGVTTIDAQLDPGSYVDLYNVKVDNPSYYSLPRRIRLGVSFNF